MWKHWLTECQLVVGLNWCPVHTTLPSCWSMSLLVWFLVACPWPGGWLSFMSSLTRHWLHNFVMNCIPADSNHTQSIGKHLFHLCYEEVVCPPWCEKCYTQKHQKLLLCCEGQLKLALCWLTNWSLRDYVNNKSKVKCSYDDMSNSFMLCKQTQFYTVNIQINIIIKETWTLFICTCKNSYV